MKKAFILFAAILFIACQKEKNKKQSLETLVNAKTELLDSIYTMHYKKKEFNGNVLVAENGKIVYQKSFGLAHEKDSVPLNLNTRFELASVSKQFTAVGIVLLHKEDLLSYEDDITKFIPELSFYQGITVKNLLIHTSGLPDYMELAVNNWDKSRIATNKDIIKLFQEIKPETHFKPDEDFEYSNTGYLLLATIIERVSGEEFEDYLKEKIFDPLDMNNTFIYRRRFKPQVLENYAEGYFYSDSLKRKVLPDEIKQHSYIVYLDGIVGDGIINSNVYDLLKWDRALYGNKLINSEDKELIFSSYPTKNDSETNYGFGWEIEKSKKYQTIVYHSGSWGGYITYIERHLDNDKTIIILQNNDVEISVKKPIKNTRCVLYELSVELPIKLSKDTLIKYAGTYLNKANQEQQIIFKEGKLWAQISKKIRLELIPVSKTKFIVDGFSPEVTYTFSIDRNNTVDKYKVQQIETGVEETVVRK